MSVTYQNLTTDKTRNPSLLLYGLQVKMYNVRQNLRKDLQKLAKWCAKWRIKVNPEKTKVIIFSRSPLTRKSEPVLKPAGIIGGLAGCRLVGCGLTACLVLDHSEGGSLLKT